MESRSFISIGSRGFHPITWAYWDREAGVPSPLSAKIEFREVGLCPKCSAPIEYSYTLTGPEGEDGVRVYAFSECPLCGFKESKNMLFPLSPIYSIRYLFHPTVRIFLEKVRLAIELKRLEEAKAVGGVP